MPFKTGLSDHLSKSFKNIREHMPHHRPKRFNNTPVQLLNPFYFLINFWYHRNSVHPTCLSNLIDGRGCFFSTKGASGSKTSSTLTTKWPGSIGSPKYSVSSQTPVTTAMATIRESTGDFSFTTSPFLNCHQIKPRVNILQEKPAMSTNCISYHLEVMP